MDFFFEEVNIQENSGASGNGELFGVIGGKTAFPVKRVEVGRGNGVYYKNQRIRFVKHRDQWWIVASDVAVVLNESITKICELVTAPYKDSINIQNKRGFLKKTIISLEGLQSVVNIINTRNSIEFYTWAIKANGKTDDIFDTVDTIDTNEIQESLIIYLHNIDIYLFKQHPQKDAVELWVSPAHKRDNNAPDEKENA
jgi:hypothetical protein